MPKHCSQYTLPMPSSIHLDEPLTIGDCLLFAPSPSGKHAVVFEDDGQTG